MPKLKKWVSIESVLIVVVLMTALSLVAKVRHVEARAVPISLEPGEVGYFLCANSYHTIIPHPTESGFATVRCNEAAVGASEAPEDDHVLLFPGQEKDVTCGGGRFEFETYGPGSLGAVCIAK